MLVRREFIYFIQILYKKQKRLSFQKEKEWNRRPLNEELYKCQKRDGI